MEENREVKMDIDRLCPGCMREVEAEEQTAGQQDTGTQSAEMRKRENLYAKIHTVGIQNQKCPYCGFDAAAYRQNARCLPINTILAGKYLVGAVLGEGGFGITYIGYDLNMQTRIAIKEYFPVELVSRDTTSMTGDRVVSMGGEKSVTYKQGLKKYVAEAQNVSQFSEIPGVVSVKDFFYENETAYIVMEYIDGISLKDYLKERSGRLSEEESLAIMKPVLEALVKVHEAGIVHRDISPDNIMLTFRERGNGGAEAGQGNAAPGCEAVTKPENVLTSVKLIDFGAARMTAKNDQKSLTIILKHGYDPEEQYRTHGEQGPWTDVYAVCAVLYRMLTGQTLVPAMDRMFQDELKSFDDLNTKVSRSTQAAILKGLAVKREDRIQTMDELIQILYGNKKIFLYRWSKGRRAAMIAGMAAALGIIVVIGVKPGVRRSQTNPSAEQNLKIEQTAEFPEKESPENPPEYESTDILEESSQAEYPEESIVEFQEEQLGETVAYPSPQTSISVQEQSFALIRMPDGTVRAMGANESGQCMVSEWTDIVAVSAGYNHSLGLRSDGKVFAAGDDANGKCSVDSWENVVQIATGMDNSFAVTADGHILAVGPDRNGLMDDIADWEGIVAITVSENGGLIGLDREGAIRYAGFGMEMPAVSGWQGVKYLSYGRMHGATLIGIKEDGTVLREQLEETLSFLPSQVEGENGQYAGIEDWTGMQQICANTPVLGVREDGTVAYLENSDRQMQEALEKWNDMEAVASVYIWDRIMIIGLTEDGELVEYRQEYGNADMEDMVDLDWVQIMEVLDDNIVAKTKDGKILTHGLEFRMQNLAELNGNEERASEMAGIVGMDAILLSSGRVYMDSSIDSIVTGEYIGENVKQALELWGGGYGEYVSYGYAFLTYERKVEIVTLGADITNTDIIAEKYRKQVQEAKQWTDIIQIAGAGGNLYALHSDGTISATNPDDKEKVAACQGICKIAERNGEIIGIREDGSAEVILASENAVRFGRTQVNSWADLADVSIGESHVAGLKTDGTVVAAGSNHEGQCDVEEWTDIVYLITGRNCTLGITAEGELKMAGSLF